MKWYEERVLPKDYQLTKKGLQVIDEFVEHLLFTESPANATRSKRQIFNEIAKKTTAALAIHSDDPSQLLILPSYYKKRKQSKIYFSKLHIRNL